jgi:hypothetical protein
LNFLVFIIIIIFYSLSPPPLPCQIHSEPLQALEGTDIEGYLAHHHDMIFLSVIDEARKKTEKDVRTTQMRYVCRLCFILWGGQLYRDTMFMLSQYELNTNYIISYGIVLYCICCLLLGML